MNKLNDCCAGMVPTRIRVMEHLEVTEQALNDIHSLVDALEAKIHGPKPCGQCGEDPRSLRGIIDQAQINKDKAITLVNSLSDLVDLL